MKLLCFDTSTDACTVALGLDDAGVAIVRESHAPRVHARRLIAMIDEVLAEAAVPLTALDAIAVGRGPGSFTGVRIGCAVAQGLAFGAQVPVLAMSSLAMLAARFVAASPAGAVTADDAAPETVLVAQDARMGEVYWALFAAEGAPDALCDPILADRLDRPQALPARLAAVRAGPVRVAAGAALGRYGDLAAAIGATHCKPDALPGAAPALALARAMLQRGDGLPPEQAVPVYFRSPV